MAQILVTYASKHHSTAEIAEAIAQEIRVHGHDVVCEPANSAAPAAEFDAIVIGSAVYMGRWRPPARKYLKRNIEALSKMPFWIFSSGPVGETPEDPEKQERFLEPRKVIERAEAAGVRGHVVFGGRVPQDADGYVEKSMLKNTPQELQDLRDWDAIRAWAQQVADSVSAGTEAAPNPA
jgi:menaquinone-dependent protoporphyrinogen oxidase